MNRRYFIQLVYNGSPYCGWQIQPGAESVQGHLARVLSVQLKTEVPVVGAGRTDTGVHASFFVAHFETESPIADIRQLTYKLNSMLPFDIQVQQVFEVDGDLHARFSALSRTYKYFISRNKEPFRQEFVAFIPHDLDIEKMNQVAQILFDYTDFTSFSKLHTDVKTNNCRIEKAEWRYEQGLLVFEICADRFLRNMVRAIVGTLIKVGKQQVSLEQFRAIIEAKDRCQAGASVPAKGLFLTDIQFPEPVNSKLIRNFDKTQRNQFIQSQPLRLNIHR